MLQTSAGQGDGHTAHPPTTALEGQKKRDTFGPLSAPGLAQEHRPISQTTSSGLDQGVWAVEKHIEGSIPARPLKSLWVDKNETEGKTPAALRSQSSKRACHW